jgi:hypothetical protein
VIPGMIADEVALPAFPTHEGGVGRGHLTDHEKVALTPCAARVSRIPGVAVRLGPSSKVRRTEPAAHGSAAA